VLQDVLHVVHVLQHVVERTVAPQPPLQQPHPVNTITDPANTNEISSFFMIASLLCLCTISLQQDLNIIKPRSLTIFDNGNLSSWIKLRQLKISWL